MKILNAEFIRSCYQTEQFPKECLPEVVFLGRSNVGKSSLINSLLNRKKLAMVSRTPGKTRAINFFRITVASEGSGPFFLVDLPGYGYAKVPKEVQAQWEPLLVGYMTSRPQLSGICWLVDSRGLEERDWATWTWLQSLPRPVIVVATKVDKVTRGRRQAHLSELQAALGSSSHVSVIGYSAMHHEGREALWRALRGLVKGRR